MINNQANSMQQLNQNRNFQFDNNDPQFNNNPNDPFENALNNQGGDPNDDNQLYNPGDQFFQNQN